MNTAAAPVTAPAARIASGRLAPIGPGRPVDLPSAEARLRYAWHAWAARAAGLAQPHRLRLQCHARYVADFAPTAALRQRWAQLFDLRRGPGGVDYPFLYARSVAALLQARVFADLGVHARHCLLLSQDTRLHGPAAELAAASPQRVDCALARVVRVGPTEVLVLMVTQLHEGGGRPLATLEEGFLVRELEVADAVQAEDDDAVRRAVSRMRRRSGEIDPRAPGVRTRQLYLAPGVARRYARIGGDPVPPGSAPWLRRALGVARTPVQRSCLRELVVRELAEWGLACGELQLCFVGRARTGQTLRLQERQGRFELLGPGGQLLAYGQALSYQRGGSFFTSTMRLPSLAT